VQFRRLDDAALVAGQIEVEDVDGAAALGVAMIVNNRPDGEEPGQPAAAEIEAAAKAAGLAYRFIPVAGGIRASDVDAMAAALGEARGPVLAFCRSGTRSAYLWALARARMGEAGDSLAAKAAAAGYDLAPIRDYLG
jgi:uncharacterized protein (TIGR01244 family)